jgi:5-hydroxyisourate hydrolase
MTITAQALDGVYGRSAAGLPARLDISTDGRWQAVAEVETDERGQIDDWTGGKLRRGLYRIVFDSDRYFVGLGVRAAYPEIAVLLRLNDESDGLRVQVLFAPHTYSTFFLTDE